MLQTAALQPRFKCQQFQRAPTEIQTAITTAETPTRSANK